MNNCDMYQELISRLVDGELSRDEYAALEAHMNGCAECSAMYAVFASLSDIISGEDEPLPEDLHENIMAGVRRSAMINHNKRRLSKPMRNALAAAACAALVLFAARGLSPAEKAAESVLTKEDTQVMAAAENAAEEPAALAATAEPTAAAVPTATVQPTATPRPTPSPIPTADVYLSSDKDEAKPVNTPNNNTNNSVVVTPKPTEIVVHTPSAVSTPSPTATPDNVVTVTASPDPAAVVSEQPEAPAEAAPAAVEESVESAAPVKESGSGSDTAAQSGGTDALRTAEGAKSAATEAYEPQETEPTATETPSLSKRLFSFFSFAMPEAVTEAAPEAAPEESLESPQLPAPSGSAEPKASAEAEALENEAEDEETAEDILIKLEDPKKLTELEDMLDGEEAELPEEDADESYCFALAEPGELLKDYELRVYIYGEEIYYVQLLSEDMFISCKSSCTLEDFGKFMDGLSDSEKGIEAAPASPSPDTALTTASPAPASAAGKMQAESAQHRAAEQQTEQK